MRSLPLLLASLSMVGVLWALPVQAQTVDYEIPTEYDLVPGQLSVTFADTTSEATAYRLLQPLGYDILEASFLPVRAMVELYGPLTPERKEELEADPSILKVESSAEPLRSSSTSTPLLIDLLPTLTEDDAWNRLGSHVDLFIKRIDKRPPEIVVKVPVDREDEAMEKLSALPAVDYVSFIAAN